MYKIGNLSLVGKEPLAALYVKPLKTNETTIFTEDINHLQNETGIVGSKPHLSILFRYLIPNVISLTLLSLVIIFVNALVVIAFFKQKKLRSAPANVLICSQSMTDLFTGLVFIPVCLVEIYLNMSTLTSFLTCYILFLSLFNLLALSSDRYLALSKPFLHHRYIDLQRTAKLLLFIWIIPLLLTLIPLCWWCSPLQIFLNARRIYLGIVWSFMLVLCTIMFLMYTFITTKAKKTIRNKRLSLTSNSRKNIESLAQKELRVIHLFGLLLFFFIAAYLPILYMNLCDILQIGEYIPEILELIGLYSFIVNSIVNPVLCIYLKKDFFIVICKITRLKRKKIKRGGPSTEISKYNSSSSNQNSSSSTELKALDQQSEETSNNVTEEDIHLPHKRKHFFQRAQKESTFSIRFLIQN